MDGMVNNAGPSEWTVLIRADASPEIGTGHVMRCLALAHAIADRGGRPEFASSAISDPLRRRIEDAGFAVVEVPARHPDPRDLATLLALARQRDAAWVVTDGYAFDTGYQEAIRRAGRRLMVIDDYNHLPRYDCDVLLNQNLGAESLAYKVNPEAVRLFGPRYALLRPEFPAYRDRPRDLPAQARKILVLFGGADPANVTGRTLEALRGLDLEVRAVVGPLNPHWDRLCEQVARIHAECSATRIELLRDVRDMPALMAWADLAITAAGSTCWELACLGVPMVVTAVAENQEGIARELERAAVAVRLTEREVGDIAALKELIGTLLQQKDRRGRMTAALSSLVDGLGARRIASLLHLRGCRFLLPPQVK